MTGIVHALIGAGVGSLSGSRLSAFVSGVISHVAADMIPHKDLDPIIEVPLLIGALAAIAKRYGLDSRQLAGALGGVLPDAEHALMLGGIIDEDDEVFPTHLGRGKYHGPDSGERLSQVAVAIAAVWVAESKRSKAD